MESSLVVEDIIKLHKNIAVRYKEYETTDGELPPIVVLNEMRYALRATIKLLNQASFDHVKDEHYFTVSIQEAHHALRNAYHDLVDGILIQTSRMMDAAIEKYPVAAVSVLGDKRLEILNDLNEIERHVAHSRGNGIERDELYEEEIYGKWFESIVKHYRFVDQVALPEIIRQHDQHQKDIETMAQQYEKELQLANKRFKLTLATSIVIGIASIIVAFIA